MIVDARMLPEDEALAADICIVGAGPAGIALARECAGAGVSVVLLESGGLEADEATMSLARGESVGVPYDRLEGARYRAFGGSSHVWGVDLGDGVTGARLRSLDAIDFEARDWVPHSGWPFDRAHLEPFYERAHAFLRVGPMNYDQGHWFPPASPGDPVIVSDRMEATVFQFTRSDVMLDEHRNAIREASNVTAVLFANVTQLEMNDAGSAIERVQVACLAGVSYVLVPSGTGFGRMRVADLRERRFSVTAKTFVLAAGGTENARLLMLPTGRHPGGVGNGHDLVGRFFMEHPHIWAGRFVPYDSAFARAASRHRIQRVRGVPVMAKWVLSEGVRRRERLLGYCVSIHPVRRPPLPDGAHSLLRLARAARERRLPRRAGLHVRQVLGGIGGIARVVYERRLARGRPHRPSPLRAFRLDHMAEQSPNPDSRVTLSDERDALGLPLVRLDWRLTRADMRSLVRSQEILDEELRRAGVGRLHIRLDQDAPPRGLKGGWHHMGTTRMHTDPRRGVVNEDGRVHGVANLYVTGSSVFPTSGYANPLLTVCALAIRLADHVKEETERGLTLVS